MTASVQGLTRAFGGAPVLRGLDLDIAKGEFVALLGRSGSGKTTLLRTLSGLDAVQQGRVTIPERRAVVFQEPRLMPWLTVARNVTLGLREADAAARARAALTEVGLSHRLDAWPLTLSGGEAQRVALARALVHAPELLLLDEPFAALDALSRLQMQSLIIELCAHHRPAVLLVTHDVDEALLLADRAMVLKAGRIALSIELPSERPRRHGDPAMTDARRQLLLALDVPADVAA